MRFFVQVILISFLFNTQTTDGQLNESNDKLREKEEVENKKNVNLYFNEFTMVKFEQNQACLEQSGGTQYHDLMTNECQTCESRENSHERYTLCPEYQLKKANTELEKADTELDKKLERSNTELEKADKKLEQADTELEKKLEKANKEMEKKLELMELEFRKQVAISNTLAIVAIVLAIVLPTVIIAFAVRYYSRTLRSQDPKQNKSEQSIKLLKTNGEASTDETSVSNAMLESSTEPHQIPKIEEMLIEMKPQLERVSDVVATFPHFTRKLELESDGDDDDERRREFCRKLGEEFNNFDISKLQTQVISIILAIVSPIALAVRYNSRTLRSQDVKQNNIEESVKLLKTKGEPSTDETSFSIPIEESSTEPHHIPKIEEMEILMKSQLEHVSELLTRKLELKLDGEDDDERREFCRKLGEKISNFDTSKLQTEIISIILAIVSPIVLAVRYNSRTLRSQDAKQNKSEESVKFLKTKGEASTDETSVSIPMLESSTKPHRIPKLLDIRGLNDDKIRNFFQKIQHSSSKIEEKEICMKPKLEHVSDVVATFPHLTRKLKLVLDGGDDDPREFCIKLSEEIINFDTLKLKTEELKVEVWSLTSSILDVVLRRGKPPQFTKLHIYGWNDEIRKLFQTIQHSSSKIEEMVIWMKPQLEYVSDVVATFPLLTRKLKLKLELGGGDDERRFCTKLTEEINISFESSKLQTEELKVEVRGRNSTPLLEVVLRRGKPPHFIKFDIRGWNDDKIRKLFQTIQHSSTKIEEMVITMKPEQLEHVSDVVATFPHLTIKLNLDLRGNHDDNERRFCRKLTEEIINFDNSKLQTQELKVDVRNHNEAGNFLLEVVLRRGEPPQFTKFGIVGWNDDEIQILFETIPHSSSKIEEMWIWMNPQHLEHVSEVVATFPHLTRKLTLVLEGEYDEGRRFCRKLTEEITNFDTSKLQTKELKVDVWYAPSINVLPTILLLEVVIRSGEPPHFLRQYFKF